MSTDDPNANNLATDRPEVPQNAALLSTPAARQAKPEPHAPAQVLPSSHPKLHLMNAPHLEEQNANKPDLTKVTDQGTPQNMPQGDVQ